MDVFVFVEGPDDKRFAEAVIKPKLEDQGSTCVVLTYKCRAPRDVSKTIQSLLAQGKRVLFLHDHDAAPCITARREATVEKYRGLSIRNVIVVQQAIEAWYVAGIDAAASRSLRLRPPQETSQIDKNWLNEQLPKAYAGRRTEFLISILERFSVDVARRRNASFDYVFSRMESNV